MKPKKIGWNGRAKEDIHIGDPVVYEDITRYNLSSNDLAMIEFYTKGKEISENARKTLTILSEVFGGLHHIPQKQLERFDYFSTNYNEVSLPMSLATWDTQYLTLLVIICHDMAVRMEIHPSMRNLRLTFHQRKRESKIFWERHPTLEETIEGFRENNKRYH